MADWSLREMMIIASARELVDTKTCLVGIGVPNVAAALARKLYNPSLELVFESGIYGADSRTLALSIGDPNLVLGSRAVMSMWDLFAYYLQAGRIEVGFLGGAQIDKFGSLNTSVIGDYANPKVRLPGTGGAPEISAHAQRTLIIMPHSKRSFVDSLDYVSSPGCIPTLAPDRQSGRLGGGPSIVVTDLGVLRFDWNHGELVLHQHHQGVDEQQIVAETGWPLVAASDLTETAAPTDNELAALRALDPTGIYRESRTTAKNAAGGGH